MPSLVYAPGIKVYIDSYKHGIIDVSEDITDFSMVRRSDGVSTFNFNLQNTRRKYDNVFTPNDRIVVMMKRLVWMRTFTGYLNSVPLFTAWPRVVPLTASCSLKRLQYFWWDSTIAASEELVRNALQAKTDFGVPDGGIKNVVLELLDKVVRWNDTSGAAGTSGAKVHIGNIPDNWYQFAVEIAQSVRDGVLESQALAAAMRAELGGGATIYGQNDVTQTLIPPGKYGGRDWGSTEVKHASTIITIGRRMGASERDLIIALMVAMAESELRNTASKRVPGSELVPGIDGVTPGDHASVGLFQQQPWAPWIEGTDANGAQRLNPEHAATAFFKVLLNMKNRGAKPMHLAAQAVQASFDASGNNYKKYENHATQMVQASTIPTAATQQSGIRTGDNAGDIGSSNYQPRGANATTGRALVEKAIALVEAAPNIRYTQDFTGTRMNILTDPTPPGLDCSSFCQWVLYQQTGSLMLGNKELPRTAALQAQFYAANGGKKIGVEQAMKTPGAFLFKNHSGGPNPGPDTYHVVMSLGNGRQVIGAHRLHTVASVKEIGANYWDFAMLMPSIQYVQADTGQAPIPLYDANSTDPRANGDLPPRGGHGSLPGTYGGTPSPDSAGTDEIDALFGTLPWQDTTPSDGLGNTLTGVISLANDEPILQYIKTLMNTTLRSFSSAPNGDFIGWFPDYYGLWGTAAVMQLEPIEVVDFTVDWSDDYFVTHQFVTASNPGGGLDLASGNYQNQNGFLPIQDTAGIASIDEPAIMRALFGYDQTQEATEQFTYFIYQRFGARPNWTEQPGITGHKGEFFYALFLFMRQWAYQYNANVDLTFMPEVWPGMLIQMPFFNFQAYVTTVTHTGSFGPGGGFKTQVNIASPARLSDKDDRLQGLPIGGKYEEGRSKGDPTFIDRAAATSGPLKISDNNGAGGRGGI